MFIPHTHVLPRFLHGRSWMHLPMELIHVLVAAQRRARERQELAEMDPMQLKDIGLSEADRAAELRKPVWRR